MKQVFPSYYRDPDYLWARIDRMRETLDKYRRLRGMWRAAHSAWHREEQKIGEMMLRYRRALRRQAGVVQRLRRENRQLRCTRTAAHVTIRRPGPSPLGPEEIWDGE